MHVVCIDTLAIAMSCIGFEYGFGFFSIFFRYYRAIRNDLPIASSLSYVRSHFLSLSKIVP